MKKNLKQRFQESAGTFMYGRNGMDRLSQFMLYLSLLLLIVSAILFSVSSGSDLAPLNRASYNVRKKRKKTNKGAERRWQERTTQLNRSLSSCGR